MPLFTVLRAISKYGRSLRYADALNSSQRYLINARTSDFKTTKRPFHQSLRALEKTSDRNLKVNTDTKNRIYGRVASVHVNKTRNMASEQGGTGIDASQKESDDLSLPFWIFLWSFLAIIAGFIYSKLNRQREIESELKSGGNGTTNDEQIARKLVNEIAKKDSGRKPTFRRQRSYEIIDGEVRIHYDVSMLDDSMYKSANIEGLLKTAEVESIPIGSTSLDDLEFVYPGKLPRIVEEGDEDLLEGQSDEQATSASVYINEGRPDAQMYLPETKGKETEINIEKVDNTLNSKEVANDFEANGLHFEGKRDNFPTNFETITQETLIPTESINDANKITISPQKDNCVELSHEAETNLKEIKNETTLNESSDCESSSTSGDSVIENVSTISNSSRNSLHNSNTTSASVYKLTQLEKTQEHKFTVTRREITKLKSSEEKAPKLDSFRDETSFPLVETKESKKTAEIDDNSPQLSRDFQSDGLMSQQGITQSGLRSDNNIELSDSFLHENGSENEKLDCGTIVANKIKNCDQRTLSKSDYRTEEIVAQEEKTYCDKQLGRQEIDDSNFQQKSQKHEQIVQELSSGDVYECPDTSLDSNEAVVVLSNGDINECLDSTLQEPCVLTCLEEGSDILVDNSGDILFKVIGPSTDEEYFEDNMEDERICGKTNVGELTPDENENYDKFGCKNELTKNWKSLPSWEGFHCTNDGEVNSDSSDVDHSDLEMNMEDDVKIGETSGVVQVGSMKVNNNELEQKNSGITNEQFPVQNAEELVFNEDIKDAHLLTLENTIGSRKTIFVKDAAEPVHTDETWESFVVETGLNVSSDTAAVRGDEEVTLFGEMQNENTKPDTLECEISDEILVAEPIQTHKVKVEDPIPGEAECPIPDEAECPIPGEADSVSDEPVLFAKASVIKEDVLMAKIITVQDPGPPAIDVDLSSSTNCATNLTEAKMNTIENIPPERNCTTYTNTDASNTENSLVYSRVTNGDLKHHPKTQTTSVRTVETVTQLTHTKVHSIVKKFEKAKKPNSLIQTENGNTYSNSDVHETPVINKNHEQPSEVVVKVESPSVESFPPINCNKDGDISQKNMPKDRELVDHGRVSGQAIVSTIVDKNEEDRLSDLKTNINFVVGDPEISEQVHIPAVTVETEQSDEPGINSDSINFIENVPTNIHSIEFINNAHDSSELKSVSDKSTSSYDPPNKLELGSYADTKNAGDIVEDAEDIVIYANQVTESCAIGETVEAIHARPVGDCSTTVVYASQISDSENNEETYYGAVNNLKQPNGNSSVDKYSQDKATVVYANQSSDNEDTTVAYTGQVSEIETALQPVVATTNPSHTKIISPNHITEEDKISILKSSDMDLTNPTSISPQPNNESRSFRETSFDATLLICSPVTNKSSSELQESIPNNGQIPLSSSPNPLTNENPHEIKEHMLSFDKVFSNDPVTNQSPPEIQENEVSSDELPSSYSPAPEPIRESPSELWQNLPRGETNVDSFSDIDEIDLDILPDENYQKSKSVTDLDEALASFGGLDCLLNDDQDNMTGGLSKSVPDILDSCREESLRETVANPTTEALQKKNLSLSTPEINSKTKPGSKKVTKIKIVHVKFLEMQSDSENVEEDSFIYEGDHPITGKMKRRSRNLSDELRSPVASPPPDLNREIAQERWIAGKTNLKQLEFEFGDLFQNSPSPPPLETNNIKCESSTKGSNRGSQSNTDIREDATKFQNASMVYSVPDNLSSETTSPISSTNNSSKSTSESQDPTLPDSSTQKRSSTEVKNHSFSTINPSTTKSSRFEVQNQRTVSRQSTSSTVTYYKTSAAAQSNIPINSDSKLKSDIEIPDEYVIPALPLETKVTSSTEKLHLSSNIIRSKTIISSGTKSKVEYQNIQNSSSLTSITSGTVSQTPTNQDIPSITPGASVPVSQSSRRTDSVSYRYTPGNQHSYSTVPKPVPEHGKYVVKSGTIVTQSTSKQTNTRNITTQARYSDSSNSPRHIAQFTENPKSSRHTTTQARYIDSPNSSSPSSSPRHGIKLSDKFHMSDGGNLAQKPGVPSNQIDGQVVPPNRNDGQVVPRNRTDGQVVPPNRSDGQNTRKSNQRGSSNKGTSRHEGRMVTVKGGIISDYECSSDADSEMSYNVPSPRIKAKRFHRPQVHRVDSASSSEPDSPRRQMIDARRSMSELFGVDEGSLYSSDTSKDGRGLEGFGKERGSQNSLKNQKLFLRFGNVEPSEETVTRQNKVFVKNKPSSSYVHQAKATIFDPRPIEPKTNMGQNNERLTRQSENIAKRNPGPPNVSQARNVRYDQREPEGRIPNLRYNNSLDRNPSPPNVYQARATTFDQRPTDTKTYNPRYTNALERNLSPTSFLQEGNLGSDDQLSPKTIEFNPFEDVERRDSFEPFERCHSPSSVYSDTSSVFSFNCDFDPMPPPTGTFKPEVYTCENPTCRKQDVLLGPEKTSFKSCPACFTYYCSSECRKLHWPSHKQNCYFGRVNTYVRSIIRLCQRREDLSMYLSQIARDGYKTKGRGVVMAIFNNPELAREFITKGHDAFSGRKPTYSSLAELHREGVISKHRVALMQAVRDYEPNQEFVFNIAVVATNNIPITPAPRYKLNTVLHCIKMPLNDLIVARQPKDYDKVETRLFALPKCSRHEFVNEMEARRHYCRNLSKNLRQYNIKLKEDYPECYRKLCMYVEHNISFEPMTVYGQRGGINYKCVIAPEQTYPLNAEYC